MLLIEQLFVIVLVSVHSSVGVHANFLRNNTFLFTPYLEARSTFRHQRHPNFRRNNFTTIEAVNPISAPLMGPKHIFTNLKPAESLNDFLNRKNLSDFERVFGLNIERLGSYPFAPSRNALKTVKPIPKSLLRDKFIATTTTLPSLLRSELPFFTQIIDPPNSQRRTESFQTADQIEEPSVQIDPHLRDVINNINSPIDITKLLALALSDEKLYWKYLTNPRTRQLRKPTIPSFFSRRPKISFQLKNLENNKDKDTFNSFSTNGRIIRPNSAVNFNTKIPFQNTLELPVFYSRAPVSNGKSILHPFNSFSSIANNPAVSSNQKEITSFTKEELSKFFNDYPFLTTPQPTKKNFNAFISKVQPNIDEQVVSKINSEISNFRSNILTSAPEAGTRQHNSESSTNNVLDPEFYLADPSAASRFQPEEGGPCITSFMDRGINHVYILILKYIIFIWNSIKLYKYIFHSIYKIGGKYSDYTLIF